MTTNAIQSSHIYSTYFAPRGRSRIYTLGMQIAQLYLSPFDQIIGFIGEAGSGKSVLIKGMFPGIELTNDDDGVNVRPLPLLEQEYETGFFTPHTYHLDIRFETGFHQLSELADAVRLAVRRGKRIIIEHFDLIYPFSASTQIFSSASANRSSLRGRTSSARCRRICAKSSIRRLPIASWRTARRICANTP